MYGGNFRIFRIEEHHTKIKTYELFLAQYINVNNYVLRHYAQLYEYGSSYENLHHRKNTRYNYGNFFSALFLLYEFDLKVLLLMCSTDFGIKIMCILN